jgi:transcriptional regulator with XRE-family HTH domain
MPAMMRRERERQGLTLEQLARLAGVSRSRLSALERGEENVSLEFVLKAAHALGMTELRVSGLSIAAAPPDLTVLVAAADAIETARKIVDGASSMRGDLDRVSASVSGLLDRVLTPLADPGIAQAAARLASREDDQATARALRELAESPDLRAQRPQAKPEAKSGRRKRVREPER